MNDRSWVGMPPAMVREEGPEPEILPPVPPAEGDSLDYLQSIYRDPSLPTGARMRAAIAALPFERPKLAVTAHLDGNGGFGDRLERVIAARVTAVRGGPGDGGAG